MRKFLFLIAVLFIYSDLMAQWKPVSLKYRHLKQPGFFVPSALHFSDSSNGFMVSSNLLLQYKNYLWQQTDDGPAEEFSYTNVFTINPRNTFLCGYDGKFSKYNGNSLEVLFQLQPTETINPVLTTIFMTDSSNGWVAGDAGILLKVEGNSFTEYNQGEQFFFRDMQFDNPGHGWLIGYAVTENGNIGVVFEYSGGNWVLHSNIDEVLYDIEFSPGGNGFIAGEHDIYRFKNVANEWQQENIPDYYRQFHISMLTDDYGMSVSDNSSNLIYENGSWSVGPVAGVSDLFSIKLTSPENGWAISQMGNNDPVNFNDGKMQLLRENAWEDFSLQYLDTLQELPVDFAITSIAALNKKNVWFDGQYVKLPEDKSWLDTIPILNSDSFCFASKIFSTDFGLGIGDDLKEWTGQYWANKNLDAPNPDSSISNTTMHVFDDTTAYICRQILVWSSGEIKNAVSCYDYKTNSITHTEYLDTRSIFGIHFSNKRNGWCVGDSGLIAKFTDGHWQVLPSFTDKRLYQVFTIDSSAAWAVGDNGTLLKYDGTNWEAQLLPTEQNLHSISFVNKTNGWIAGDSGLIYHYNGSSWLMDTTETTNSLYSIYMVDSLFGFAGGDNGTLLQLSKPAPVIHEPPVRRFCENGDTYFSYNPVGTSYVYQWQVDTGNGFENISANNIYSGVMADTLWLTSIPSSYYGYKFRCIASYEGVDSISAVEELRFVNRWIGQSSLAWEDPGNWSCGALPGENTNVIIDNGSIILHTQTRIRSLTASPGVNITIAEGASLDILK